MIHVMIEIRCETADSLCLNDMRPFQGDLKSRTGEQLDELKRSLLGEGLLAPFFIWKGDDGEGGSACWILDGHARHDAISSLYKEHGRENLLFLQKFPVVYVEAGSIDDAKKALLQITSSYGDVTRRGAISFCGSIPGYRAPSVAAFLKPAAPIRERAVEDFDVPVARSGKCRTDERHPAAEDACARPRGETRDGGGRPASCGDVSVSISFPSYYKDDVMELLHAVGYIRVLADG